ncbi:hypothetical protein [Bacillus sp. UMB0728]|nr:hypothetical protein [Bacillus sp. UMB0728]
MSRQEKMNEMLMDLQQTLENDDIEEALTILCMMKNAEQLDEWVKTK